VWQAFDVAFGPVAAFMLLQLHTAAGEHLSLLLMLLRV
jgi:hypothetical protein